MLFLQRKERAAKVRARRNLKLGKIKAFTKTGKPRVCWHTKWGERELLQEPKESK
jgi:hypothetical protein